MVAEINRKDRYHYQCQSYQFKFFGGFWFAIRHAGHSTQTQPANKFDPDPDLDQTCLLVGFEWNGRHGVSQTRIRQKI